MNRPCTFRLLAVSLLFLAGGCSSTEKQIPISTERSAQPLAPGTLAAVDQLDAFDSLKLGSPISSLGQLHQTESLGRWKTFTRPSDSLNFAGAELNGIAYHAYDGIYYSAHVEILGKHNVQKLLNWTEKTNGTNFSAKVQVLGPKLTRLIVREWQGRRVDVVFKFAEDLAGGTLILVDHALWLRLNAPKMDRSKASMRSFDGSWSNLDFD